MSAFEWLRYQHVCHALIKVCKAQLALAFIHNIVHALLQLRYQALQCCACGAILHIGRTLLDLLLGAVIACAAALVKAALVVCCCM